MNLLGQHRTEAEHDAGASSVPWSNREWSSHLHLESEYLATAMSLSPDAPGAHAVALFVDGWLGQEAVRGKLIADPNVCDVNEFGDRTACTRLAPRSYSVALTRLRAEDPACAGRKLYAITGAGLSDGLTLVMYPYGDRVYLKHGNEVAPLHYNDPARH